MRWKRRINICGIIVSDLCKNHYLIHFTAKKKSVFFHPLWISVELQTASLGSESMSRRSAACVIPCCLFISWLIAEVTLWDGHPNYLTVLKYPHWVPAVTSPAQHTLTGLLSFIKGGCKSLCTAPQETDSKIKKNIIFFKLKHHMMCGLFIRMHCAFAYAGCVYTRAKNDSTKLLDCFGMKDIERTQPFMCCGTYGMNKEH